MYFLIAVTKWCILYFRENTSHGYVAFVIVYLKNRGSSRCYLTQYTTMQLCLKYCGPRNLCNCYITLVNQLCTSIAILMIVLAIHIEILVQICLINFI